MVRCEFCDKTIETPRKYKGKIVQRFCDDTCRWKFHNGEETKMNKFAKELIALLGKYGLVR